MRNKRMLLSCLMAGVALCLQAQQTAVRALADGHYEGAKQQLERLVELAFEPCNRRTISKKMKLTKTEVEELENRLCDKIWKERGIE